MAEVLVADCEELLFELEVALPLRHVKVGDVAAQVQHAAEGQLAGAREDRLFEGGGGVRGVQVGLGDGAEAAGGALK
jgi:hypothetical protein